MKLPYIVILTIFSLLITLLHDYKDPTFLFSQTRCAIKSICVVCPQLFHSGKAYPLQKYTRVSHTQKFYVLSTSNSRIIKPGCRDVLQMVERDHNGVWVLSQQMRKQLQNVKFKFQPGEQVTVATGTQYHAIISEVQDYLIFYETDSSKSPSIYIQNEYNPERIMKISRSLSWGMLWALILKYLDSHIGIFNVEGGYSFPLIQILMVIYQIYISYEMNTFSYIYVAQLMFLVYLQINLIKKSEIIKLFAIFLVFLILGESYCLLANLFWLIYMKTINPNFLNHNLKIKISSIVVILGLVADVLVVISKFNYFIYLSYAYKIISIPVSLMMFQVEEQPEIQPKRREINLGRYVAD